jgi:hypothetical protein
VSVLAILAWAYYNLSPTRLCRARVLSETKVVEQGIPQTPLTAARRILSALISGTFSFLIVLLVAGTIKLWAYVWSVESASSVEKALMLQSYFESAISAFDPNQLLLYLGDSSIFLLDLVAKPLSLIFSQETANNVAAGVIYPFMGIVLVMAFPVLILIEAEVHGQLVIGVLATLCWLVVVTVAWSNFKKSKNGTQTFFPYLEAVLITFAFLWSVKLLMIGSDHLLSWYTSLSKLFAGGTAITTMLYWCTKKTTEHSATEAVLHWGRSALKINPP